MKRRRRCSRASTRPDWCMSSPRICRSRTTPGSSPVRRSRARSAARRAGSASPRNTTGSTGATFDLMGTRMEKGQELYKGKAKTVYATDDPRYLVMHYRDDVSAFDGAKLAKLDQKGETNNKINAYVMGKLAAAGVPTHFVRMLNERESLVRAMKM